MKSRCLWERRESEVGTREAASPPGCEQGRLERRAIHPNPVSPSDPMSRLPDQTPPAHTFIVLRAD